MNKVAILYICIGKYTVFWPEFYNSAEAFLLPECEKTYFVFTDCAHLPHEEKPNVVKIHQSNMGWPGNTLYRYGMFGNIESLLLPFDYLFFFNANITIVDKIDAWELLPTEGEGLTLVRHPGLYDHAPNHFPYDRNPRSAAYIPPGHGTHYYMGGVNGGRKKPFLDLIRTLHARIMDDYARGVTALHYDESHLNHYALHLPVKVLTPSYGYPEGPNLPFHPKVYIKDKMKWGGHFYLRN
jgi:hypothetical protein